MMSKRTRSQVSRISSQQSQRNTDVNENLQDYINKCVRYFIYRSSSNEPIKKTELKKNVLTNVGKHFDTIIKETGKILDTVYGFNLVACEDTGYITVQNLQENENELQEVINNDEVPTDIKKVLVLLVLTNIFMSTSPVNEASLYMFLNALDISPEEEKGIFGKIKDFINTTMVKQNYIVLHTDQFSKEVTYKWGARAEATISKRKVLDFVAKIYGDKQPSSWVSQYEEANQQFNNNGDEVMQVD